MATKHDSDDEPVPRLPRSFGFKLSMPEIVRIAMTAALLVMIVLARRPCADSVSEFVTEFDKTGSNAARMPKPGRVDVPAAAGSAGDYESLRPDMSEAEIKAAMDRARARAAAKRGAGSAATGSGSASTGSGSASTGSGPAATGSGSAATGSGSASTGSDAR